MTYDDFIKLLDYLKENSCTKVGDLDMYFKGTKEDTIIGKWEEFQIIKHINKEEK